MLPVEIVVRNVAAGLPLAPPRLRGGTQAQGPHSRALLQGRRPRRPDAQLVPLPGARGLGRGPGVLRGARLEGQRDPRALLRRERRNARGLQDRGRPGRRTGELMLADEISPDTCRFWDKETGEKLDKDRFRQRHGRRRGGLRGDAAAGHRRSQAEGRRRLKVQASSSAPRPASSTPRARPSAALSPRSGFGGVKTVHVGRLIEMEVE